MQRGSKIRWVVTYCARKADKLFGGAPCGGRRVGFTKGSVSKNESTLLKADGIGFHAQCKQAFHGEVVSRIEPLVAEVKSVDERCEQITEGTSSQVLEKGCYM
jgi:hypothetical protein